jgi:Ca2+-binding RTX toxin-like protein
LGEDQLDGGNEADVLAGGQGNDLLTGGDGDDLLFGGDPGVFVTDGNDVLNGGLGNDRLDGGSGNDLLNGGGGVDDLIGWTGNDVLDGGAAADLLNGGAGVDLASYASSKAGVVASLMNPALNTGDAAGDSYNSVEGLIGSQFDDTLTGNLANNTLRGGIGNDTLSGLFGNDVLAGGAGDDHLDGGWGNDTFAFNPALDTLFGFGTDTIHGWQDGSFLGNDVISFQGLGLSFADLTITYSPVGATVAYGRTDEIIVLGAARGSLGADDFLF